jgi:hypothetical protein
MIELTDFKSKSVFWSAFAVHADFQKYAKKTFEPKDIEDNFAMAPKLDALIKKLNSEVHKINKMNEARNCD